MGTADSSSEFFLLKKRKKKKKGKERKSKEKMRIAPAHPRRAGSTSPVQMKACTKPRHNGEKTQAASGQRQHRPPSTTGSSAPSRVG